MSEMVVFTQHENFDFLRFSSRVAKSSVDDFKAECVRVQATQAMTAQSFGVWALRLADLKSAGVWEDVINPETGFAFFNEGFGAFCRYAFGISETATSNLTKIAQFVVNHGDNVGQLRENYKDYSFSQLVELSSVSTDTHKFFKPTMTVKEMRVSKDYVKNSVEFRFEEKGADYDLLSKAQKWKDKDKKPEKPIEVIPGQINLDDISDSIEVEVHSIPTSELANAGEEEYEDDSPEHQEYLRECEPWIELTEEKKELAIKIILIKRTGEIKRKRIYEKYKENPLHSEFVTFIKDEYGHSGFGCDGLTGQTCGKGYKIEPFEGNWTIFLTWAQIASRIVTLINRGEYYTEESVIPTSELANAGERVSTEEEREELLKNILLFEPWLDKRKRLYDKYKGNCSMYEFLLEVKTEYMFKSCSSVKGGDMQANSKGFVISFPGMSEFFVDWEQIASRIVTLINRGEYYTEDDERIEQARESAHKAGIPFYEGDAEEFNPYVYDGKMSVEDYKLMHEQMEADKAVDDYDEADESYEDMQGEMQTIEQDSEKSLPQEEYDCCEVQKGVAPWLKPDFKNRDGIREFYQAYMSWEQLYCRVPCVEVYRYKFKIGTLYAVSGRVAGILEPRESREIKYSVRYFWQDKGDSLCYETTKEHLERFIPLHKDEM